MQYMYVMRLTQAFFLFVWKNMKKKKKIKVKLKMEKKTET